MRLASSLRPIDAPRPPAWCLVALGAAAVLVSGLFLPLTDGVTAFYGTVARHILASGDWLTMHGPPMPVVDKPPLTFWLMSLAFRIFGRGEWALRVWHLALAFGTASVVYALARLDRPPAEAWAAAAVLLTALGFFYQSLVPEQHVPLAFFLALAVYWHLRWERGAQWWTAMLAWFAAALAVLTVGIAGAAMAALVAGAHLAIDRPRLPARAAATAAAGGALFLAVAAPWFVAGAARLGRPFVETFFLSGTLGVARFFHHVQTSPTIVPWWVGFGAYVLLLPLGVLPWTGWLWPALREGWAARTRQNTDGGQTGASVLWTCTLWILVLVAFLSASLGDKSSRYLMPVFPPVAVLLGHVVVDRRWTRPAAAVSLAIALPLLGVVTAVAFVTFPGEARRYAPLIWGFLPLFAAGLAAYAAAAFVGRPAAGVWALAVAALLSYQLTIGVVGRIWDQLTPWRPLARVVNACGGDARVLMLGADNAFVDYYVARPVRHVDEAELREAWAHDRIIAIVPAAELPALPSPPAARILGRGGAGLTVVTNVVR